MGSSSNGGGRVNSFALVAYIPPPLGLFLDRVRQELVPSCVARSHVTILPPRPLETGPERAQQQLTEALQEFAPFFLDLTSIEMFEQSAVIYLAIGSGVVELKRMHDHLNQGCLCSDESHFYHPHITLAKDFPPHEAGDIERLAKQRWTQYTGPRSFEVDRLTFVQNTDSDRWVDLGDFSLGDTVLATR